MSGNYFCHVCGGLVDLIKLQPSDVRLCECENRFARLRAENNRLKAENKLYAAEMSAAKEDGFYSAQELFVAYQNLKAECAKAEKDAGLWREREAKIKSLKERGFLKNPLRDGPYKVVKKGK